MKNAYTLVEFIVAMIVISILVAVVITKFPQRGQLDLPSARDRLVRDLGVARNQSVSERVIYGVYFQIATQQYSVYQGSFNFSNIINNPVNAQPYVTSVNSLFQNVQLTGTDLSGAMVQFNEDGVPFDASGTLNMQKTVTLTDTSSGKTAVIRIFPGSGLIQYD